LCRFSAPNAWRRASRTYEKVGFQVEGTLRDEMKVQGRWHNLVYMGILAGEVRE
jgi:RimJ/RimL family protein N-acetyltransferase